MQEPTHQKAKAEENRGKYSLSGQKINIVTSGGALCILKRLMK